MASWSELLKSLNDQDDPGWLDRKLKEHLDASKQRGDAAVIFYASAFLQKAADNVSITREDINGFMNGRYNGWVRRIHLKGVLQVENVQFEVVEGNRLVIHVDLNHRGDISASGKTRRVASTLGNVSVKDASGVEVKIGLNVYVKPDV